MSVQRQGVLCHLIASGFAGGPEKQIIESSPHLAGLGWQVVVGSFRENRPSVEVIENAKARGLQTFLIDTRSPFNPHAVLQLRRYLKHFDASVLITHGYKPNLIGRLAVAGLSVVQLPVVRGYTAEDWKVRLYEAVDRWLLRRMPKVLTVSEGSKRKLIAYGVAEQRIEVVHNAVDCSRSFEPVDLRREFSLPAAARVVVAAGRLSPEKGHRYLVEAMKEFADRQPAVCAVILGSGKEQAALEEQIGAGGLEQRVFLGGFRRPILPYLAAADVVVNPSLTEGLPNVVLEAMSVRKPVVATDVGGVGELVLPGKTGWLVPAADPRALAHGIDHALEDVDRSRAMAEGGHRLVAESFSFAQQARRLADLFAAELGHSCGPARRSHAGCSEVWS